MQHFLYDYGGVLIYENEIILDDLRGQPIDWPLTEQGKKDLIYFLYRRSRYNQVRHGEVITPDGELFGHMVMGGIEIAKDRERPLIDPVGNACFGDLDAICTYSDGHKLLIQGDGCVTYNHILVKPNGETQLLTTPEKVIWLGRTSDQWADNMWHDCTREEYELWKSSWEKHGREIYTSYERALTFGPIIR